LGCELVRVESRDGLELAGIYVAPTGGTAKRAVLHTHGLAGNFYENRFISDVSRAVAEKGLAFLATNNRGHDYRSDNLRGRGLETTYQPGGSTHDIFEECVHDIGGAADFLAERGHEEIYFEGHSLGCSKSVYYLSETRDDRCAGVILISPPELFGLQDGRTEGDMEAALARARELVAAGGGGQLLDVGRDVPYAAATFVSMYGDRSVSDVFPLRHGRDGDYTRLASIDTPVFVAYGNVEEAVNIEVSDALYLMKTAATSSPKVEGIVIDGANHVYWGHEEELAEAIAAFVKP
jgi:pimeloyl-ACP methyl ester carboxylesterase